MPPAKSSATRGGKDRKQPTSKTKTKKPLRAASSKGKSLSGRVAPHRRETLTEVSTFEVKPASELKYRRTGKYKCVVSGVRSLTGVHPALRTVCANFDYDEAKARDTLFDVSLGDAQYTENVPVEVSVEHQHKAYSCKEGQTLDRQVGQIVAWHHKRGVRAPLQIWYDKRARDRFFRTGSLLKTLQMYAPISKDDAKSIEKLCNALLPETMHIAHYCHANKYTMVATQVCVARGSVGTRLDLLLQTLAGTYIVVELKRGCQKSWTEGHDMSFPYRSMQANTHNEYLLQTMLGRRLFQHTYPTARLCAKKPCMLLRMDAEGLHEYHPPPDMLKHEEKLGAVLRC